MARKAPPSLRSVQPFLTVANQFEKRDPIISYYANMYAVQEGLSVHKGDPVAKAYLNELMDKLQQMKRTLKEEEAMSSDVVAQVHIEDVALRLFKHADEQDRAARFDRNMIKAFFTSSHIFTTLKQFGELSDEVESKMKYAKWKAVEIDRCLKGGVPPTPGPPAAGVSDDPLELQFGGVGPPQIGFSVEPSANEQDPSIVQPPGPKPVPKPRQNIPQPTPQEGADSLPIPSGKVAGSFQNPVVPSLGPAEIAKAQKLCKFASSALDYEDVQGAIEYLGKAMNLLTTGRED